MQVLSHQTITPTNDERNVSELKRAGHHLRGDVQAFLLLTRLRRRNAAELPNGGYSVLLDAAIHIAGRHDTWAFADALVDEIGCWKGGAA